MSRAANPLSAEGGPLWPVAGPAWRQRLLALHDGIVGQLARAQPARVVRTAARVARLANRCGVLGPSPRAVAMLYPWLPASRLSPVAAEMAAQRLRNRVAIALVLGDRTGALATLVRWRDADRREALAAAAGGMVLATCHIGAFFGIRAAMHPMNRTVLVLRDHLNADAASRARALKLGVDVLRAGGLVVATLDGPGGTSTREVACLDRWIAFRRGPLALARLAHVPMVPAVCTWMPDGHIVIDVGPAVEPSAAVDAAALEGEMARHVAAWFDATLRAAPELMWPWTLGHYLAAPPVEPSTPSASNAPEATMDRNSS